MADDEILDDDTKEEEGDGDATVDGPDVEDLADADADDDADDDDDVADDDDDDDAAADEAPRTKRKKSKDDDDDDDDEDLVDDDDVEEDLDKILKDRLVAKADDEDDDEVDEAPGDTRGEGGERLQPKQQNEQLCSTCFLLVKSSAPNCPVGDDDCPIFS